MPAASRRADAKELKELGEQLAKAIGEVKTFAEKAETEIKSLGNVTDETKQKADEALTKHTEVCDRIDALEQKLQRRGSEVSPSARARPAVIDADEVKAFLEPAQGGKSGSVSINVKAIISSLRPRWPMARRATSSCRAAAWRHHAGAAPAGHARPHQRRQHQFQRHPVCEGNGFTNSAATVSETTGPTKPQSDIQFDLVTAAVTTMAHFVLATRQILSDVPMLQSYIDGRLRYGLGYVEDNQILNGAGTGTDLNGIYTQATAFTQAATLGTAR
jgi:Sec-independent protein translocase protein TatA